jgi:hypothetical protein
METTNSASTQPIEETIDASAAKTVEAEVEPVSTVPLEPEAAVPAAAPRPAATQKKKSTNEDLLFLAGCLLLIGAVLWGVWAGLTSPSNLAQFAAKIQTGGYSEESFLSIGSSDRDRAVALKAKAVAALTELAELGK